MYDEYNLDNPPQPSHGTLSQCLEMCRADSSCKAFSWPAARHFNLPFHRTGGWPFYCYLKKEWIEEKAVAFTDPNNALRWKTVQVKGCPATAAPTTAAPTTAAPTTEAPTTVPCLDISGSYVDMASNSPVALTQDSCSGSSGDGWTYKVTGSKATIIGYGVTGIVDQQGGLTTITWSNGATYTQDCLDISGSYVDAASNSPATLAQDVCSGNSSDGWTYTIVGIKATIVGHDVTGTVDQQGGITTIAWSNGATYTEEGSN
jgi:hypothetical protein